MDRKAFERYLTRDYEVSFSRVGLGARTASTVASRCLRVEAKFGVDLDDIVERNELDSLIDRVKSPEARASFNYAGPSKMWFRDLVNALQKYAKFRKRQSKQH